MANRRSTAIEHSHDHHSRAGRIMRWQHMPMLLLFLVLLVAFAYTPPRWQDWNQNSRFNLTRALVEQGTVRIDAYVANTGDYALIEGRAYTDKAPGLSLMAVPVHAVTEAATPYGPGAIAARLGESESFSTTLNPEGEGITQDRAEEALALYIATFFTVVVPAAVMLVLLAAIVLKVTGCRTASILSALIVGLATPVFTYSQAFYGHVPAAVCLTGAIALLVLGDTTTISTRRVVAIGALLGWAVVIELPVALAAAPVAIWTLVLVGRRAILPGVAGALPALAVLAAYDLVAFGTVTPVGYQHSALWQEQHSVGFMSLTYPHWEAMSGVLWSEYRGLFFYAPVLLLVFPGVALMFRSARWRPLGITVTASFGLFFLFVASSTMWWGGFGVGPRYLIPVVPLLAIPLGMTIAWLNQQALRMRLAGLCGTAMLALVSGALVWSTTFAGQSYPPDTIQQPVRDYVVPLVRDGDVARNIGMVAGLTGIVSIIPLLAFVCGGVLLIGASVGMAARRSEDGYADAIMNRNSLDPGDEIVTQIPFSTPRASSSPPNN